MTYANSRKGIIQGLLLLLNILPGSASLFGVFPELCKIFMVCHVWPLMSLFLVS